nr:MAG TPA: hypothetical protein [Caudoviricetes sp.]
MLLEYDHYSFSNDIKILYYNISYQNKILILF